MVGGVHGAFLGTTADLHESFEPRAGSGSGMEGGTEAGIGFGFGFGFGSEVRSPAAAPKGLGCAESGAGLGPC